MKLSAVGVKLGKAMFLYSFNTKQQVKLDNFELDNEYYEAVIQKLPAEIEQWIIYEKEVNK